MVEIMKYPSREQAVILAGGRGVRMGEVTADIQKCMLEVDGAPILEHILFGLSTMYGAKVDVVIATGYKGDDIREYFGKEYEGMSIQYVHDERPLETKRRLLLARDIIVKPFMFLAGDILAPTSLLEQIRVRFDEEKYKDAIGIIAGAHDHSPAPTHAVLSASDGFLSDIQHPPPEQFNDGELREMHRAMYSLDFIKTAVNSEQNLLSRIVKDINDEREHAFGVVDYYGTWGHYAEPHDLQRFNKSYFDRRDSDLKRADPFS